MIITEYFKHDINASDDDKICELLANGGYEMFGYYWRFIEYLYSRGGFVYKNKLKSVAWILHMEIDKLNDLIYNFGLFIDEDDIIYSQRVLNGVQEFEAAGKRMAEIGRKGGQASAQAYAQARAKAYAKADGQASGQQNKENKKNKKKKINKRIEGFAPPPPQEVEEYCRERGNDIDAEYFVDYYTANGWKRSNGNPICDWKAVIRTWEKKQYAPKQSETISSSFNTNEFYEAAIMKTYGDKSIIEND